MTERVEHSTYMYYLGILRLFWSRQEIGDRMQPKTSFATVQRWEKGITLMTVDDFDRIKNLLLLLSKDMRKHYGGFYDALADALAAAHEEQPIYQTRKITRSKKEALQALAERLTGILYGKTRRSDGIIETLVEDGYTGAQVQRVARQLGVKKTTRGFGPKKVSYWSLKK